MVCFSHYTPPLLVARHLSSRSAPCRAACDLVVGFPVAIDSASRATQVNRRTSDLWWIRLARPCNDWARYAPYSSARGQTDDEMRRCREVYYRLEPRSCASQTVVKWRRSVYALLDSSAAAAVTIHESATLWCYNHCLRDDAVTIMCYL